MALRGMRRGHLSLPPLLLHLHHRMLLLRRQPDTTGGFVSKKARLQALVARYQRKAAAANARADRLEEQLVEERRKNQVLRSARSVALYSLHRVVRELEVFDDRFMGEVHTGTGTVKSEPPAADQ